jgi:hypothetical protein
VDFVKALKDAEFANWTVEDGADDLQVKFVSKSFGDKEDFTSADFGLRVADSGDAAVVTYEFTDGVTTTGGKLTFGSVEIQLTTTENDGDAVAAAVRAALDNDVGFKAIWTVTGATNVVTLTAVNPGVISPPTLVGDGTLDITTVPSPTVTTPGKNPITDPGIVVAVTVTQEGIDSVGIAYDQEVEYMVGNGDYLDFTAYGAKAVYVNGNAVVKGALSADSLYISLSNAKDAPAGTYEITLMDAGTDGIAGSTDSKVGTIGIVDFGGVQDFIADNFILYPRCQNSNTHSPPASAGVFYYWTTMNPLKPLNHRDTETQRKSKTVFGIL